MRASIWIFPLFAIIGLAISAKDTLSAWTLRTAASCGLPPEYVEFVWRPESHGEYPRGTMKYVLLDYPQYGFYLVWGNSRFPAIRTIHGETRWIYGSIDP